MSLRPRDKMVRCPYCHRNLIRGRGKGDYVEQKYCPDCGQTLPQPNAPRYNAMMHGAKVSRGIPFGGRACPLEVFALIAMTAALLS